MLLLRKLEQKIIEDINASGLPIDAIYFVMKNIMQEIESKYFEYAEADDQNENLVSEENESAAAKEEGGE